MNFNKNSIFLNARDETIEFIAYELLHIFHLHELDRISFGIHRQLFSARTMQTLFFPSFWIGRRSEEHTSELQSRGHLVCRLLLEKKKNNKPIEHHDTI